MPRVGILVPEFPGQTHSFFWRELASLEAQGVEGVLISTRRPPPGLVCHDWTELAVARTHYLIPPKAGLILPTIGALLASPSGLAACARSILQATGMDVRGKARLMALAAAGAELKAFAQTKGLIHVHAHSAGDAAHVALFAKLLGGPNYSLTLHGPLADYGPNQREKWRHAAFGIVITKTLRRELEAALGDALPSRLAVAPMGVAVAKYVRTRPYEAWDGMGPLRVFSCGRLNPVKGHDDLARAVLKLRNQGLNVQLRIAGEDDKGGSGYRKKLEGIIADLGLSEHVTLLGAISEERVRSELSEAHVFALGSHHEPLGVAIMEAMALSVPVVVTSAGGVPELVDDGVDGLLVDPRSPHQMADQIRRVACSPDFSLQLARAARVKIEQQFDSSISARVIATLSASPDAQLP